MDVDNPAHFCIMLFLYSHCTNYHIVINIPTKPLLRTICTYCTMYQYFLASITILYLVVLPLLLERSIPTCVLFKFLHLRLFPHFLYALLSVLQSSVESRWEAKPSQASPAHSETSLSQSGLRRRRAASPNDEYTAVVISILCVPSEVKSHIHLVPWYCRVLYIHRIFPLTVLFRLRFSLIDQVFFTRLAL